MKSSVEKTMLFASIAYIIIGICLIAWPSVSKDIICYILGAVAVIFGISRFVAYNKARSEQTPFNMDLLWGVALMAFGLFMIIKPGTVSALFGIFIGIAIIIDSIIKLQICVNIRRMGVNTWQYNTILSVIALAVGVLLVINPFTVITTMTVCAGVGLLFDGIINIWCLIAVRTKNAQ